MKDGVLYWHEHKSSAMASGSIDLASVESVTPFEVGGRGGCFSFVVKSPDRSLFLRAESKQRLHYWTTALRMHVHLLQVGRWVGGWVGGWVDGATRQTS